MNGHTLSAVPLVTDLSGRMAGEYRIGRMLGEGGCGAVYEAEHPVLKRRAAVKVLHRTSVAGSSRLARFIAEAQATNQIRSRNIVDVFSFGALPDGRAFYVMDLLDGEPLDRHLARMGRVPLVTTLQILRPIAHALDIAHAAGIVHRDLKPQNVFLAWEASGETVPKLLDFGVAKLLHDSGLTVSGTVIGTPRYMSPEQARGDRVDARADVYALGVLCHEMLTGHLPFDGESALGIAMAHIMQPPPTASSVCPDLPEILDRPILRMLAKHPDDRPTSAGEAIEAVVAAAHNLGHSIPPLLRLPKPEPTPLSRLPTTIEEAGTQFGRNPHVEPPLTASETTPKVMARPRRSLLRWGMLALIAVVLGLLATRLTKRERPTPAAPTELPASAISEPAHAAPAPASVSAMQEALVPGTLADGGAAVHQAPSKRAKRQAPGRREAIPRDLENPF